MQIPSALGIAIMINNFFHNVAAALLAASGIALWVILKDYERHSGNGNREVTEYFLSLYTSMTRVAKFSLYWILIGGVPRTLFYRDFEWVTAVKHGQVPALIVMHVLAIAFVFTGVKLWIKVKKRVNEIEQSVKA